MKDDYKKVIQNLKKNELINKLIQHYEHETLELANQQIEHARLKHLIPVEHKKHVRQDLQSIKDMAEDVKRMRKERLKKLDNLEDLL